VRFELVLDPLDEGDLATGRFRGLEVVEELAHAAVVGS
jgi:hypothetical protein